MFLTQSYYHFKDLKYNAYDINTKCMVLLRFSGHHLEEIGLIIIYVYL